jgi:hypothetical protein
VRQREHVISERIFREGSRTVENCAVEIFIQRDFAALKGRNQHLMAVVEIGFVQLKLDERAVPFRVVPGVGQQHSADIPEESSNFSHDEIARCDDIMTQMKAENKWSAGRRRPER